ncbi:MAG: hypothetical protein WBD16_06275 [Pyrinomonadaceae bacterium]
MIDNFLADADFNLVRKKYRNAISEATLRPYKEIDEANLYRIQIPVNQSIQFRRIEKHGEQLSTG